MTPLELARRVEMRAIGELKPYARNPATHSADQVRKIARSIEEFGFTNPILVDGASGIVAGHGRLAAALQLGMAEVPVIELAHLTEAQKKAYRIADNRLARDAGWDDGYLRAEIEDLREADYELELTGLDAGELERLLEEPAEEEGEPDSPSLPSTRAVFRISCQADQAQQLEQALSKLAPRFPGIEIARV